MNSAESGAAGNQSLGPFLAKLRHDLRTPLNAILGYSEMLLEDASAGGAAALVPGLQKLRAAGGELLALVNETLAPDQVQIGRLAVDIASVAARLHTPSDTVVGYSESLLEDGAALAQPETLADLQKIYSAAVHFRAQLDAIANFARPEGTEPAAETETRLQGGVETGRPLAQAETAVGKFQGEAVLIVDDTENNRDVLSRWLERQGLTTVTAENGRHALELVGARPFDVVLLDVLMPEMNGYQVLQTLKADPLLRDIPVIMISSMDDLSSVVRCIELGAEDYLAKPFDPVLLHARVGASLDKKRLRDQEVEYLRNVDRVIDAAAALEAAAFEPGHLDEVAARGDKLGQLARTFQRMAREVQAREQRLQHEVQLLRIEIDEAKAVRQVEEISESDFFQDLVSKAERLRFSEDDFSADGE